MCLGAVFLTAEIVRAFHGGGNLTNITSIFLLLIIAAAVKFGMGIAIMTAVSSVLVIDYYFCPPINTFVFADASQIVSLCIFLFAAILTSHLASHLRARLEEAQQHEEKITALSQASWDVASESNPIRSLSTVLSILCQILDLRAAAVISVHEDSTIRLLSSEGLSEKEAQALLNEKNAEAVHFVGQRALPIGNYAVDYPNASSAPEAYVNVAKLDDSTVTFLPVVIDSRVAAVLYLRDERGQRNRGDRQLLAAFLNHIALALQREKLWKAEATARALAEADTLKTALLSMVSHDFRSPLTSIKTNIGALKGLSPNDLTTELKAQLLEAIDDEIDRLNRMIGNILDLSRLEAGAWQPKCEPVPVSELIGSVLSTFDANQDQRIETDNSAGSALVWLDTVQIHQVLRNLLENALKYSPIETKVELRTCLLEDLLQFDVLDRGMGLVPEDKNLLFRPFYRAKTSAQGAIPGTGMGLAICRGLVEAHGGNITAEPRPGGGTCFRVTLPHQEIARTMEPREI
jgi:two-component system sensor histidine kinase KdpD